MELFRGVGVALVTRFSDDGAIDASATADLASALVALGLQAVVVAGSTGEAATLERDERVQLLDAVRAAVPGTPVLAGTGAPSARQAVALTTDAVDHGADALLVLSPPRTGDPRPYFDAVAAAAGDVPVLAYHFPAVSGPGISIATLRELPVAGCKDSSGEPDRLLEALTTWDGALYTGCSGILALAGPLGCRGAILALANYHPELCVRAFDGDPGAQRELAPQHLRTRGGGPAGVKRMVAERFGGSTVSRQ
ncbi:MAG: dihydrodipicolinate synthase family protein [Actinobacteria bacterium]|nr:dihydrodipicolinate synthase family protein [Actinomycetota bacterium]